MKALAKEIGNALLLYIKLKNVLFLIEALGMQDFQG
jgi:hypothetical protein